MYLGWSIEFQKRPLGGSNTKRSFHPWTTSELNFFLLHKIGDPTMASMASPPYGFAKGGPGAPFSVPTATSAL